MDVPRIQRRYLPGADGLVEPWEDVSLAEFERRTEWGGYFKKGTALEALKVRKTLRTPFAEFRIAE